MEPCMQWKPPNSSHNQCCEAKIINWSCWDWIGCQPFCSRIVNYIICQPFSSRTVNFFIQGQNPKKNFNTKLYMTRYLKHQLLLEHDMKPTSPCMFASTDSVSNSCSPIGTLQEWWQAKITESLIWMQIHYL